MNACAPDFRSLVRSALLTGTRYGELVRLRVGDFDRTQCILHIPDGKTGVRDVVLSNTAFAHFRELSKGKLPGAFLHARDERDEWGKSEQSRRVKTNGTYLSRSALRVHG